MEIKDKFDIIRKRIADDNLVYMVDTNTTNYDIISCKVTAILEGDFICEGEVPEQFQKIFRSKTFRLKWNDRTKHLIEPNLAHFAVNTSDYQLGWNLNNIKTLRKELISKRISYLYTEVERLIIIKNNS
jgi:hypothetical protein